MTFGQIKTTIENNLLESYKKEDQFKKTLREFKHNVLSNKSMSRLYNLYDQLSTPAGLTESESKEFLDEGIKLIQSILPSVKLPKSLTSISDNRYTEIDTLVYSKTINLKERVEAKTKILTILQENKEPITESIKIPISTMVKIANQKVNSYIETLNEDDKKELISILSEDSKSLESKFDSLRESTISKLQNLANNELDSENKIKISETIEKIKEEKFDQINYYKLKSLEESI
jgi:hypothetical protein